MVSCRVKTYWLLMNSQTMLSPSLPRAFATQRPPRPGQGQWHRRTKDRFLSTPARLVGTSRITWVCIDCLNIHKVCIYICLRVSTRRNVNTIFMHKYVNTCFVYVVNKRRASDGATTERTLSRGYMSRPLSKIETCIGNLDYLSRWTTCCDSFPLKKVHFSNHAETKTPQGQVQNFACWYLQNGVAIGGDVVNSTPSTCL